MHRIYGDIAVGLSFDDFDGCSNKRRARRVVIVQTHCSFSHLIIETAAGTIGQNFNKFLVVRTHARTMPYDSLVISMQLEANTNLIAIATAFCVGSHTEKPSRLI